MNEDANIQQLNDTERLQIGQILAALILAGLWVIVISKVALRVPVLRNRLQAPMWRARLTGAGYMACYTVISRLLGRGQPEAEPAESAQTTDEPSA